MGVAAVEAASCGGYSTARPSSVPDRYAATSPAARLPLGVPALLTHGGKDDIVPPAMSEEFHAAARAAGDECELVMLPERGPLRAPRPGQPAVAGGGRVDPLSREHAVALDAADPLREFRDRFVDDDPRRIYLDGNSLGRLPLATRDRLAAIVAEWGERLVSGWPEWIDAPARVGDLLAEHVLGARPGEVIVSDSTTVNLFKLCSAVLDTREGAIVTDRGNFPTDRYVLEGLAARHGRELRLVDDAGGRGRRAGHRARRALARRLPLAASRRHRRADRRHRAPTSSGTSRTRPARCRSSCARPAPQLAVGCTYKYLNAGPGAPAFLYVAEERQAQLRSPIWGWFGQRDQFAMERDYDPADGVGRFQAGTPPILGARSGRGGRAADRGGRASTRCARSPSRCAS